MLHGMLHTIAKYHKRYW